jgi:hypothetical protein
MSRVEAKSPKALASLEKAKALDIQRLEFVALWRYQSVVFQGCKFSGNFTPKWVKKA